jgi:D-sedoheptulose 7-phosphate isomerase
MDLKNYIKKYFEETKQICDLIDEESIVKFINAVKQIKSNKGRLFIIGVGGSAANASHAVNDFRKILNIESYAITDNVSELTAIINDDGWDTSFENWLKVSNLSSNDSLLVFSVGGGSETVSQNIVKSMELAKSIGSQILSVVSRNGGKAKELSDACILIPVIDESRITPHAEEWQGIILHLVVNSLYKKN